MNDFRTNIINLIIELSNAINLHDGTDTDRATMLPLMDILELRSIRDNLLDMAESRSLDV